MCRDVCIGQIWPFTPTLIVENAKSRDANILVSLYHGTTVAICVLKPTANDNID